MPRPAFAGLAVPTVPAGFAPYTGLSISESLSGNLDRIEVGQPVQSRFGVSGNASLKLASGTYVVQGGGVTLSGNASVEVVPASPSSSRGAGSRFPATPRSPGQA